MVPLDTDKHCMPQIGHLELCAGPRNGKSNQGTHVDSKAQSHDCRRLDASEHHCKACSYRPCIQRPEEEFASLVRLLHHEVGLMGVDVEQQMALRVCSEAAVGAMHTAQLDVGSEACQGDLYWQLGQAIGDNEHEVVPPAVSQWGALQDAWQWKLLGPVGEPGNIKCAQDASSWEVVGI